MKKYGYENFTIEQIDSATSQEDLNNKEFEWILKENSCDKTIGYNLKNSKGKCGGDTLSCHSNKKDISNKIALTKIGGLNPNASKVKAINVITGEEFIYNSFKECQSYLNIERHDIIGRRCKHIIAKPYDEKWLFEYVD